MRIYLQNYIPFYRYPLEKKNGNVSKIKNEIFTYKLPILQAEYHSVKGSVRKNQEKFLKNLPFQEF